MKPSKRQALLDRATRALRPLRARAAPSDTALGADDEHADSVAELTAALSDLVTDDRTGSDVVAALASVLETACQRPENDEVLAPLVEGLVREYAAREPNHDRFAELLADVLPIYAEWDWGRDTPMRRHFERWQGAGFTLLPNHHHSPVPDAASLDRVLARRSELVGVDLHPQRQLDLVNEMASRYRSEYEGWSVEPTADPQEFFLGNPTFGRVDAELLHCMLRHHSPGRVIEVGSGWSTVVALGALSRNAAEGRPNCEFTAIEPYPPVFLQPAPAGLTCLIEEPLEDVDLALFESLGADDVLFIDSTHVLRTGSDVALVFLDIVPRLAPGVLVHVHDIFLPAEYPRSWVRDEHVFWNEQYLLQAFLAFNHCFEVVIAASWLHLDHPDTLAAAFPSYGPERALPGSLWLRRTAA